MLANQTFIRLHHIVRVTAVVAGLLAGVGLPLSFGLVTYFASVSSLEYRTGLAADRLAEYVYVQGKNWRFNENRIVDMIASTRINGRQVVYDSADRLVASLGAPLAGPTLRIASPIVSLGETAGKVEAEISLLPLLLKIGILGILGIALGGAVFAGTL